MGYLFERMTMEHRDAVMAIFNHYIEHSFAAYLETPLPLPFFEKLLGMAEGYPAYVIIEQATKKMVGFCFLHAYNPLPAFRQTAEISYFLAPDEVGRGIGALALQRLERDASHQGITRLLASISSENTASLAFHRKHGFTECGRFPKIGQKWGTAFDVIWMEKAVVSEDTL